MVSSIARVIAEDQAQALRHAAQTLDSALLVLETFDAHHAGQTLDAAQCAEREALLITAADFLWRILVQREACGLIDHGPLFEVHRVPADVRRRVGVTVPLNPRD